MSKILALFVTLGLAVSGQAQSLPEYLIPPSNMGRVELKIGRVEFFGRRGIERSRNTFRPIRSCKEFWITFFPRKFLFFKKGGGPRASTFSSYNKLSESTLISKCGGR